MTNNDRRGLGRGRMSTELGLERRSRYVPASPSDSESDTEDLQRSRYNRNQEENEENSDADDFFEYISKQLGDLKITVPKEPEVENAQKVGKTCYTVHPWLNTYFQECFFNWIPAPMKMDHEEANYVKDKLTGKFLNYTPELIAKGLQYTPFENISHKLISAFCHVVIEDHIAATKILAEVTEEIAVAGNHGFISEDYLQGFKYLKQGLEAFNLSFLLGEKENTSEDFKDFLASCMRIDELPKKGLLALKAAKAFFYGCIRFDQDRQIRLFQEISEEDPDTVDWKLNIHFVMRLQRKETNRHASPSAKEREIIVECLKAEPNHLMVKLAVVAFLGDTLRNHGWKVREGPLQLTEDLEFKSLRDVQIYVKKVADELLGSMGHSYKINLHIAEVFTMCLPSSMKDAKLGKECLLRAVEMNPGCSKANHRLGIHYFTVEENYDEALACCAKAYECDRRNFPALIDKLQLMMRNLVENRNELGKLFHEELDNPKWSDDRRASLYVLFGTSCFMMQNYFDCIDAWETAYMLHAESLGGLKNLANQSIRYGWNSDIINPEQVQGLLERKVRVYGNSAYAELLQFAETALVNVRLCILRMKENASRQNGSDNSNWRAGGSQQGQGPQAGRNPNWRPRNSDNERRGPRSFTRRNGSREGESASNEPNWRSGNERRDISVN